MNITPHLKYLLSIKEKQDTAASLEHRLHGLYQEIALLKAEINTLPGDVYEELGIKQLNNSCTCYSTSESGMSICGCKGSGHSPK